MSLEVTLTMDSWAPPVHQLPPLILYPSSTGDGARHLWKTQQPRRQLDTRASADWSPKSQALSPALVTILIKCITLFPSWILSYKSVLFKCDPEKRVLFIIKIPAV